MWRLIRTFLFSLHSTLSRKCVISIHPLRGGDPWFLKLPRESVGVSAARQGLDAPILCAGLYSPNDTEFRCRRNSLAQRISEVAGMDIPDGPRRALDMQHREIQDEVRGYRNVASRRWCSFVPSPRSTCDEMDCARTLSRCGIVFLWQLKRRGLTPSNFFNDDAASLQVRTATLQRP